MRKNINFLLSKKQFTSLKRESILTRQKNAGFIVIEGLDGSGQSTKNLKGEKIISLVNSDIFGKALQGFLKKEKISTKYILRKKISQTELRGKTKSADIIITVCGIPDLIKGDIIKRGGILVDAGITCLLGKKIVGDVNRESLKGKASFLTPVPGGLGPLTVALLFKNLYYLTKKYGKNS